MHAEQEKSSKVAKRLTVFERLTYDMIDFALLFFCGGVRKHSLTQVHEISACKCPSSRTRTMGTIPFYLHTRLVPGKISLYSYALSNGNDLKFTVSRCNGVVYTFRSVRGHVSLPGLAVVRNPFRRRFSETISELQRRSLN